jgi:hypothetical protein
MELNLKVTPVFTKNQNAYNDGYKYIINQGGSRCFAPNTLIETLEGNKSISEIKTGDMVKTMNEETKEIVWKQVKDVFYTPNNNKPSIRLKLKNGDIIECTEDHKFYFEGGFTSLKHILSLKYKI